MRLPSRFCVEFVDLEPIASQHRQQIGKLRTQGYIYSELYVFHRVTGKISLGNLHN
jgi:hypothetical protein